MFGLPMVAIQEVIYRGATKKAVVDYRKGLEYSWANNLLKSIQAGLYQVDNVLKESVDGWLGRDNVWQTPMMVQVVNFLVLLALLALWGGLCWYVIHGLRQDARYVYYYHEEPRFYMTAFKWAAPAILGLLPILGLGVGLMQQSRSVSSLKVDNPTVQVQHLLAPDKLQLRGGWTNLDGLSANRTRTNDLVNRQLATTVDYLAIESNVRGGIDNQKNVFELVKRTQVHLKLAAYRHSRQVGFLINLVYGILLADFLVLALAIWHANSAADQW